MKHKKIKVVEAKIRTPEETEMIEKAFFAGWNSGWESCKKELDRDLFIIRMEERQRFYEMYKSMATMEVNKTK